MRLTKPIDLLAGHAAATAGGAISFAARAAQRLAGSLPLPFGGGGPEPRRPSGPVAKPDDRSHTPPTGDPARKRARRTRSGAKRSPEATAAGVSVAGGPEIPEPPPAEEHVSEEATLVAEFADPGAEGGAGPNIEIAAPWDGYEKLRARDITDRLVTADVSTAAAVELYERAHKGRKLVIEAASQRLRTAG